MNWLFYVFLVLFLLIVVGVITTIVMCCKGKNQCQKNKWIQKRTQNIHVEKLKSIEPKSIESNNQVNKMFKNTSFEHHTLRLPDTVEIVKSEEDKGITLELKEDLIIQKNSENQLEFNMVRGNETMFCNHSIDCEKEGYYMIQGQMDVAANSLGEREGLIVVKNNSILYEQSFEVIPEKKSSISFVSTFYKSEQDSSGLILIVKNNSDQDFVLKHGSKIQCIHL